MTQAPKSTRERVEALRDRAEKEWRAAEEDMPAQWAKGRMHAYEHVLSLLPTTQDTEAAVKTALDELVKEAGTWESSDGGSAFDCGEEPNLDRKKARAILLKLIEGQQ